MEFIVVLIPQGTRRVAHESTLDSLQAVDVGGICLWYESDADFIIGLVQVMYHYILNLCRV